jgi:hypothetical protein
LRELGEVLDKGLEGTEKCWIRVLRELGNCWTRALRELGEVLDKSLEGTRRSAG